jgi:hypothetical protein
MRRPWLLLPLLLANTFLAAQSPGGAPATYRIPLSAVDDAGNGSEDLAPGDVHLQVGDQNADVISVKRYHNAPVRMIIVPDDSESMGYEGKWPAAVFVLRQVLTSLPPGSSVGLVGVQEGQFEVIRHPDSIVNYSNNISRRNGGSHGQTPLLDAIGRATEELPHPQPSDVIFVLSDGGDNKSKKGESAIRHELLRSGVCVTGVVLGTDSDFFPDMPFGAQGLWSLSTISVAGTVRPRRSSAIQSASPPTRRNCALSCARCTTSMSWSSRSPTRVRTHPS